MNGWIALPLLVGVAAAGVIGFQPTEEPGAIVRSVAQFYVEDLPGVRTGVVGPAQRRANTTIINRHLSRGATMRMRAGTRLEIASSLTVGSGGGIIGEGAEARPTIFMPAAAFDNRNAEADGGRYGPRSVGINFSGQLSGAYRPVSGVRLENFRLISESSPGRRLRGIVGQNVTDCLIRNVEIAAFPTAVGVAIASAKRCRLSRIHVHDFQDHTPWDSLPQSTGIEIDNDAVRGVPTTQTVIEEFAIERLRVTGPLLARWGYQTDGINVLNPASQVIIRNGRIADVGEGVDTFGSDGEITNVTIDNPYIFGLKFIHGASRNVARNIVITNPGLAGVNFSGSEIARQDTADNIVSDLRISNVGGDGAWRENSTAGILVSGENSRRAPVRNQVVNASIGLGPYGKYGWLDQSTGQGNHGSNVGVTAGRGLERAVLILHRGGSVRLRSAADR